MCRSVKDPEEKTNLEQYCQRRTLNGKTVKQKSPAYTLGQFKNEKKSLRYQNTTHYSFLYFASLFFCLFGSKSVLPGCLMQELHREGQVANQICGQSKDSIPNKQNHNLPQKRNASDFSKS